MSKPISSISNTNLHGSLIENKSTQNTVEVDRIQEATSQRFEQPLPTCPACTIRLEMQAQSAINENEKVASIASNQGLTTSDEPKTVYGLHGIMPELREMIFAQLDASSVLPVYLTHPDFKRNIDGNQELSHQLPVGQIIWQGIHALYALAETVENPRMRSDAYLQIIKVQALINVEKGFPLLDLCTEPADHDQALHHIACAYALNSPNSLKTGLERAKQLADQICDIRMRIDVLCKIGQANPEQTAAIREEVQKILTENCFLSNFEEQSIICSVSLIDFNWAIQIVNGQKDPSLKPYAFIALANTHAKDPIAVNRCCEMARQAMNTTNIDTHDEIVLLMVKAQATSDLEQAKQDADSIQNKLKKAMALSIIDILAKVDLGDTNDLLTNAIYDAEETIEFGECTFTEDKEDFIRDKETLSLVLAQAQFQQSISEMVMYSRWRELKDEHLEKVLQLDNELLRGQALSEIAIQIASDNLEQALSILSIVENRESKVNALCEIITTNHLANDPKTLNCLKQIFKDIYGSKSENSFNLLSKMIQTLLNK